MVATGMLAALGVMLAGASGLFLMVSWSSGERGGGRAAGALALDERSRWVARLRKGCPPLLPLARKLLMMTVVRRATEDVSAVLERRLWGEGGQGAPILDRAAVLSILVTGALAMALVAGALTGSSVCAIAVASASMMALFQVARADQEKCGEALREEVPEALRSMNVCFRSGLSLQQTLKQVSHELGGTLGRLFEVAAQRLEMGAPTTEALEAMRGFDRAPELSFVAVALDAQHQSGGSIGAVLEAAQESVESELGLRRSLRVQTTQAKLSARIVTVMPFVLVALFSLMSPGFLDPFFSGWAGMALLALALAMDAAGIIIVQRMLKADEE